MRLELQRAVLDVLEVALPSYQLIKSPTTPRWLMRPGRAECAAVWPTVQAIYAEFTGLDLPETMPSTEWRELDAVLIDPKGLNRVIEVDEAQHFNSFRAATLEAYPAGTRTAFPRDEWMRRSRGRRLEGGRCASQFPGPGGRHRQRAFRDALADLLPLEHGWAPTLRIHNDEVADWVHGPEAPARMRRLLATRMSLPAA